MISRRPASLFRRAAPLKRTPSSTLPSSGSQVRLATLTKAEQRAPATPSAAPAAPPATFTSPHAFFQRTAWVCSTQSERKAEKDRERTLALGHTLRILQSRLPTLLQTPLPAEILAPGITLHLFPSTHPHLPSASGRVSYVAALWTAPVAWGKVPIVGNVRLRILSERMVPAAGSAGREKLVVRWASLPQPSDPQFAGIFIFEFDERGRIVRHTIERAEHTGTTEEESRLGVFGLGEWLLRRVGKPVGSGHEPGLCYAYVSEGDRPRRIRVWRTGGKVWTGIGVNGP